MRSCAIRPLEGIVVVSLEHAIAAPFCTRQLADLGARVIKVERPGVGDFARNYDERVHGLASHFVWCNRAKESLAIDIKSDHGIEALRMLIAKADIFVQNLAPGATARMALDHATLRQIDPRLIVCDISGYGQDGPFKDRKAYDLLIQSEVGFLSVTGTAADPVKAGCSIADIAAGMYAYSNILAALVERNRTGLGAHIDISMLEAMAEWMGFPMYYAYEGADPPPRTGAAHATIYPYGPFPTADADVMLAIQNEREWASFCALVLKLPQLAGDERFCAASHRSARRDELGTLIREIFVTLPRAEVLARLDAARIANAGVNDMSGLWNHPQLAARGRWVDVDTSAGRIPALLPPGRKVAQMGAVPALGEHTDAILREIGMVVSEGEPPRVC